MVQENIEYSSREDLINEAIAITLMLTDEQIKELIERVKAESEKMV